MKQFISLFTTETTRFLGTTGEWLGVVVDLYDSSTFVTDSLTVNAPLTLTVSDGTYGPIKALARASSRGCSTSCRCSRR